MTLRILDQMQEFDQQITAARAVAQQRADLSECSGIDLTALR